MAIFGGFKALAKSGVEVLQNQNFFVKFKVFKLYWRRPESKRMFSFGVRNF